jgi:hypothetical protein
MLNYETDGLDIRPDNIKIPSGGATNFEVPGEGDEPETVKEFSAVILHHHPLFAYYKTEYIGGNNPPDCGSFDGVSGEGEPGGNCKTCPLNQFGSGKNGSKACKNRRRIYVLREGEIFPMLLSLPTGSLKAFTQYVKRQLSKGRKTNAVVTRFSLKKAVNTGGIAYSQAQFALDRELTLEERALVEKMTEQVKLLSRNVGYDAVDVIADDEIVTDPDTGEVVSPLGGNV